jgi:acyl carrier protein
MSSRHQEIKNHIVQEFLFGNDEGVANDTSFLEKGILDSTGVMALVAHLEGTYKIKVEDDELLPDNLDSIDAICAFLDRKLRAKPTAG